MLYIVVSVKCSCNLRKILLQETLHINKISNYYPCNKQEYKYKCGDPPAGGPPPRKNLILLLNVSHAGGFSQAGGFFPLGGFFPRINVNYYSSMANYHS